MPQVLVFHSSDREPFVAAGDPVLPEPSALYDAVIEATRCGLEIRTIQLNEVIRVEAKEFPGEFVLAVCSRDGQEWAAPPTEVFYEMLSLLAGRGNLRLDDSLRSGPQLYPGESNIRRALSSLRSRLQHAEPLFERLLASQAARPGPSMRLVDVYTPVEKERAQMHRALAELVSTSGAKHVAVISSGRYAAASRGLWALDPSELLCLAELSAFAARNAGLGPVPARLVSDPSLADASLWAVRLQDVLGDGALDAVPGVGEEDATVLALIFSTSPNISIVRGLVQGSMRAHSSTYGAIVRAAAERQRPSFWSDVKLDDWLEVPACVVLACRPFVLECDVKRSPQALSAAPKKVAEPLPPPLGEGETREARKTLRRIACQVELLHGRNDGPITIGPSAAAPAPPPTDGFPPGLDSQVAVESLVAVDGLLVARVAPPTRPDLVLLGAFRPDASAVEALLAMRRLAAAVVGMASLAAMM